MNPKKNMTALLANMAFLLVTCNSKTYTITSTDHADDYKHFECNSTSCTTFNISIESATLYCGGCKSCSEGYVIEVDGFISCRGDSSCESSLFISMDAYDGCECGGAFSCSNSVINCRSSLECRGYGSCLYATMDGDLRNRPIREITGSGAYSLKDSYVTVRDEWYDFEATYSGYYSSYDAFIDCATTGIYVNYNKQKKHQTHNFQEIYFCPLENNRKKNNFFF